MLFSPKRINAFGLDVSNSSIKVMQLAPQRGGGFLPAAYSRLEIPGTLIANNLITDEKKLAECVSRAVRAAKHVTGKYVVASVPEAKSFVRILKLPKLPEAEIAGAIPWELEQDIPIPIEQVYLDWQVVKEEEDGLRVLVTASPKDYIDSLIAALKLAKLRPVALELEPQATARALVGAEDLKQAVLVIDFSAALTSFVIVSNEGVMEYTSNIAIGGAQLTESISRNLGVAPKEAEKMKLDKGLLSDSKKGNVSQAMLPVLDSIIEEIRNVVNFHEAHSVLSPSVNKIILAGGGANLKGLNDYITARLNLGAGRPIDRIVLGDPWVNVADEKSKPKIKIKPEDGLGYATAVGLALRGVRL